MGLINVASESVYSTGLTARPVLTEKDFQMQYQEVFEPVVGYFTGRQSFNGKW